MIMHYKYWEISIFNGGFEFKGLTQRTIEMKQINEKC